MKLNNYSHALIQAFRENTTSSKEGASNVNPIVTELASWYERFRNAVEYREEEMILRASIERILKRKLTLGEKKEIGKQLIRELVWAQYIPENTLNEDTITKISASINLHLQLKKNVINTKKIDEKKITDFIYHILASDIEDILRPSKERETIENFIFHVLKQNITIEDAHEEIKSVQLFIAIKKAYSKNDTALLQYHLFNQYFGRLTEQTIEEISNNFEKGFTTINSHLNHPLGIRILNYVKRQIPPFLILEDMLRQDPNSITLLEKDENEFNANVISTCNERYQVIAEKVRRAVIRSIIFIALSKVFIAFAVEATYDNIVHGQIFFAQLGVNILGPIILMIVIGFLIRVPGERNSAEILKRIHILLTEENPKVGKKLMIKVNEKDRSPLYWFFTLLWISGFFLTFGSIVYILMKFHFTLVSQGVFLFFLSIVSFLAYRISQTAKTYTVVERQNIFTPLVDLFFMPIARVGRHLTEGVSQINIFLFILDFIIETPYKGLVAFFEQWFFYLHSKRDEIG